MRLAYPWLLLLLLTVPAVWWWAVARAPKRTATLSLAHAAVLRHMQHLGARNGIGLGPAAKFRWLPEVFWVLALVAFIAGFARPQTEDPTAPQTTEGIDIVMAFDISTSMRALDFQPQDRFSVAKEIMAEFIRKRTNDRIGLVVFAGEAYTQAPLTLDHQVLMSVLADIRMGVIEDGTAIGNALGVAANRLRESKAKSRIVILLTDGDSNRGNITPDQAAEIAKNFGIKVYTIQVGKGGRVPYPTGRRTMFGTPDIQEVEIPVNPELLKRIAETTGGAYFVSTDSTSLRGSFQKILDDLDRSEIEETPVAQRWFEWSHYPVGLGVLLGFFGLALAFTRFRRAV
jgi:Ca-activated chloride channel homolog